MPRKTLKAYDMLMDRLQRFNEAAARCRGKRAAGAYAGRDPQTLQ